MNRYLWDKSGDSGEYVQSLVDTLACKRYKPRRTLWFRRMVGPLALAAAVVLAVVWAQRPPAEGQRTEGPPPRTQPPNTIVVSQPRVADPLPPEDTPGADTPAVETPPTTPEAPGRRIGTNSLPTDEEARAASDSMAPVAPPKRP